ncbi:MAG: cobalt transporter CbiM [Kaiparowitsia implicata GSE-PSE-MK54-09C]|jgi:cobalt/nickel transport system permease protein|nr:cobalt transporter CbiM [Kaiparowitsia implicata GSE-PSE-MK54-09C]
MHIPDGLIPVPVALGGYGLTGLFTWYSLRQINRLPNPTVDIPKASLLTAAFFVASSIHVPVPPTSVHFVLNGLLGAVLGYYAFPAIVIGLFFQAVMFAHGGLTTLGVNAAMMGIPALIAASIFRLHIHLRRLPPKRAIAITAFLAGVVGLGLATLIFVGIVITNIPSGFNAATERAAILGLGLAHGPLMVLEGLFTTMLVLFLQRVKPDMMRDSIYPQLPFGKAPASEPRR